MEKFFQIHETSTIQTVATTGKTKDVSHTEKIDLTDVVLNSAKVTVRFSPTLLSNITDGIDFLTNYPY